MAVFYIFSVKSTVTVLNCQAIWFGYYYAHLIAVTVIAIVAQVSDV